MLMRAPAMRVVDRKQATGFSLIELLVVLVIMAIMMGMVGPAMTAWIANAKVRGIAESLEADLRLTQVEAMRRNRQAVLALTATTPSLTATPADNGSNWFVRALPLVTTETVSTTEHYIHGTSEGSKAGVSITGPAVLCMNSMGRQVTNASTGMGSTCTASDPATYTVTKAGADRSLKVLVYLGGQVRLCDASKTLSSSHPDGCP